ncbi:MAG: Methyl-accepting chemotaxis protein signaling domain protein [Firmicutes bacterium]|nr:Methyl-accepting chemotaxis protein signaling domain protein [Bacillota bacterium]
MQVKSLKAKLLLLLLPLILLSCIFLAGVSYYLSQRSLTKSLNETASAISTDYSQRVQASISEMFAQVTEVTYVSSIQEGTDKNKILFDISQATKRIGKFNMINYVALDGSTIRSDGTTTQLGDRDYIKKVIETKQPYISEPTVARSTGQTAVFLVVPVMKNGQMTGMLMASRYLDSMNDMIKEIKFKDSGYGFIADDSGMVIANPVMPETAGVLMLKEKKISPDVKMAETELDDHLINMFKACAADGRQIQGSYVFNGCQQSAVMTAIDLPGGQRWVLTVMAPISEVMQESTLLAHTMIAISFICIVVVGIFIFRMTKSVVRPIMLIRDECLLLAKGDFRERKVTVDSQDEIGQLAGGFREMRANLRALVGKVQAQSEQLAAASEEMTASSQQSAEAANQVAGSITEIADGIQKQADSANHALVVTEELSTNTTQVSDVARQVSEIANKTSENAKQGQQTVEQAMGQMHQVGEGSKKTQTAIKELEKGSQQINEIVDLISSIAGQTNLLALNAAIEAARAGEHGRGFAVVSEEVRKLAEQSDDAAQQIRTLIQSNQLNMEQAVKAITASSASVQTGITMVDTTGQTFATIVESIIKLSDEIHKISEAINKIAGSSAEVVDAIQQINEVSHGNAASAETVSAATEEQSAAVQEIASASQGLAQLAGNLQTEIAKFRVSN